MKPDARQAARLLGDPGALRAILLHGDDHGLIREHAMTAVRAAAVGLDDPFRVAVLGRDEHERLEEEATALSLSGGRRVVWVRDGQDGLHAMMGRLLKTPSTSLVVIEAGALPARGKLRALLEGAADAAVIGCYPETGRALEASIARMLHAETVAIDAEALTWLAQHLGSDRAAARSEIEKLVLYGGEAGRLGLDDVQAVVGDAASASLEDAAFSATAGEREASDRAIERALSEGLSPIALARTLLTHLHRLRQVALMVEAGAAQADAMAQLRPPVFFKRRAQFAQALSLWTAGSLLEAAVETSGLELACKRTGAPDQVLARRHMAMLAARAARGLPRGGGRR